MAQQFIGSDGTYIDPQVLAAARLASNNAQRYRQDSRGLGSLLGSLAAKAGDVWKSTIGTIGGGVAAAKDLAADIGSGFQGPAHRENQEAWAKHIYGTDSYKDATAKQLGTAINAADTLTDFIPGVALVKANPLGGAVAGGISGFGNTLKYEGADLDWNDAGNAIASGAITGAVTAGFNRGLNNATKGIGKKIASNAIARGATSGALGGAVGAGVSGALNQQDLGTILGNMASSAAQGAVTGAAMSGVSQLGTKAKNAALGKFWGQTPDQVANTIAQADQLRLQDRADDGRLNNSIPALKAQTETTEETTTGPTKYMAENSVKRPVVEPDAYYKNIPLTKNEGADTWSDAQGNEYYEQKFFDSRGVLHKEMTPVGPENYSYVEAQEAEERAAMNPQYTDAEDEWNQNNFAHDDEGRPITKTKYMNESVGKQPSVGGKHNIKTHSRTYKLGDESFNATTAEYVANPDVLIVKSGDQVGYLSNYPSDTDVAYAIRDGRLKPLEDLVDIDSDQELIQEHLDAMGNKTKYMNESTGKQASVYGDMPYEDLESKIIANREKLRNTTDAATKRQLINENADMQMEMDSRWNEKGNYKPAQAESLEASLGKQTKSMTKAQIIDDLIDTGGAAGYSQSQLKRMTKSQLLELADIQSSETVQPKAGKRTYKVTLSAKARAGVKDWPGYEDGDEDWFIEADSLRDARKQANDMLDRHRQHQIAYSWSLKGVEEDASQTNPEAKPGRTKYMNESTGKQASIEGDVSREPGGMTSERMMEILAGAHEALGEHPSREALHEYNELARRLQSELEWDLASNPVVGNNDDLKPVQAKTLEASLGNQTKYMNESVGKQPSVEADKLMELQQTVKDKNAVLKRLRDEGVSVGPAYASAQEDWSKANKKYRDQLIKMVKASDKYDAATKKEMIADIKDPFEGYKDRALTRLANQLAEETSAEPSATPHALATANTLKKFGDIELADKFAEIENTDEITSDDYVLMNQIADEVERRGNKVRAADMRDRADSIINRTTPDTDVAKPWEVNPLIAEDVERLAFNASSMSNNEYQAALDELGAKYPQLSLTDVNKYVDESKEYWSQLPANQETVKPWEANPRLLQDLNQVADEYYLLTDKEYHNAVTYLTKKYAGVTSDDINQYIGDVVENSQYRIPQDQLPTTADDWEHLLTNGLINGRQIANKVAGFSNDDLKNIAEVYQRNGNARKTIDDMLTEANFLADRDIMQKRAALADAERTYRERAHSEPNGGYKEMLETTKERPVVEGPAYPEDRTTPTAKDVQKLLQPDHDRYTRKLTEVTYNPKKNIYEAKATVHFKDGSPDLKEDWFTLEGKDPNDELSWFVDNSPTFEEEFAERMERVHGGNGYKEMLEPARKRKVVEGPAYPDDIMNMKINRGEWGEPTGNEDYTEPTNERYSLNTDDDQGVKPRPDLYNEDVEVPDYTKPVDREGNTIKIEKRNWLQGAGEKFSRAGDRIENQDIYNALYSKTADRAIREGTVDTLKKLGYGPQDYGEAAKVSTAVNQMVDNMVENSRAKINDPDLIDNLRNIANDDSVVLSPAQEKKLNQQIRAITENLGQGDMPYTYDADKLLKESRRLISAGGKAITQSNYVNGQPQNTEKAEYGNQMIEMGRYLRQRAEEATNGLFDNKYTKEQVSAMLKNAGANQATIDYVTDSNSLSDLIKKTSTFEQARQMDREMKTTPYRRNGVAGSSSTNIVNRVVNRSGLGEVADLALAPVGKMTGAATKGIGNLMTKAGNAYAAVDQYPGLSDQGAITVANAAARNASNLASQQSNDQYYFDQNPETAQAAAAQFEAQNGLGNMNTQLGTQNGLTSGMMASQGQQYEDPAKTQFVDTLNRLAAGMQNALNAGDIKAYEQIANIYSQYAKIYSVQSELNGWNAAEEAEDEKLTANQQKAQAAMQQLNQLASMQPDLGTAVSNVPILGNIVGMTGGNQYATQAAALEATLVNLLSGTSATESEREQIRRAYIPQFTDSDAVKQQKLQSAYQLIQNLYNSRNNWATQVDDYANGFFG